MTKAETMAKKAKVEKGNEFDLEKDISINKFKLDEECLSHSAIYARYAQAQAEAKTLVSMAKDNFELVQAERYDAIKVGFEKHGVKVTIPMMEKAVLCDEEVIEAKKKVREAEDVYAKLSVSVSAFEHRKSELDNLVKLYCSGYFSTPSLSADVKKNINEQTANAVRKNLNK